MGVRNLEISEAKERSRGTWQRANFIGVCNMIFEWKGACFAFSSGRKIPILHTTNGTFSLLAILVRPRLECHLFIWCLVMVGAWVTPLKFQQDSEECLLAFWISSLNGHIQEDYENPGRFRGKCFCPQVYEG